MYEVQKKPRLNFEEAFDLASSRLINFSGRSRRSEYWWWYLATFIISLIAATFMGIVIKNIALVQFVTAVVDSLLGVAVTVRRLHDVGDKGYAAYGFYVMRIITCIIYFFQLSEQIIWATSMICGGFGLYIFIMSLKDSEYENDYGPSPKYLE